MEKVEATPAAQPVPLAPEEKLALRRFCRLDAKLILCGANSIKDKQLTVNLVPGALAFCEHSAH